MHYQKILLTLLLPALFLAGCGQSRVVGLYYTPPQSEIRAEARQGSAVCVVTMNDARGKSEIGVRSSGETYTAKNDVADWVSRALADELAQLGFTVTYAASMASAEQSSPDYIVSGDVEEVWIEEVSPISFTCRIKISASVRAKGKLVAKETFSSSLNKKVFPMTNPTEAMLTEALQDLLKPLSQKISQKI